MVSTGPTHSLQLHVRWHHRLVAAVPITASPAMVMGIRARLSDGRLHLSAPGFEAVLSPGETAVHQSLSCAFMSAPTEPAGRWPQPPPVDAVWMHLLMVAMAVHLCIASTLMLTPPVLEDSGGGIPSDAKRWLSFSGGSAPKRGEATVAIAGRQATAVDRAEVRGAPELARARIARGSGPKSTRQSDTDAWSDVWQTPGRHSPDPLGGVVWWQAQAPMAGMDAGGLSLRDPLATQVQLGTIGIGEQRSADRVQQRIRELDEVQVPLITQTPTTTVMTEEGLADLDPLVRDHLTRHMRSRHDAIRACYVATVLTKNAHASGRLELAFHIDSHGRPVDVHARGDASLHAAFECIEARAATWYLGEGLVADHVELVFPFRLQPQQ